MWTGSWRDPEASFPVRVLRAGLDRQLPFMLRTMHDAGQAWHMIGAGRFWSSPAVAGRMIVIEDMHAMWDSAGAADDLWKRNGIAPVDLSDRTGAAYAVDAFAGVERGLRTSCV